VIAVRRFPRDQIGRYGVVATKHSNGRIHEVTDMVEKPKPGTEPSDLAILGRYVLTPAVFSALDRAEAPTRWSPTSSRATTTTPGRWRAT
jgi:UTP--glucose-1-phosphate uridylyltransferase